MEKGGGEDAVEKCKIAANLRKPHSIGLVSLWPAFRTKRERF